MIVFRRKFFSLNNQTLKRITQKLDKERIYDYDVDDTIQDDVLTITSNLKDIEVFIPLDEEFAQFEIQDFITGISPFTRVTTTLERDIYVLKINGKLTEDQYYKLIKHIIDTVGFITLLD